MRKAEDTNNSGGGRGSTEGHNIEAEITVRKGWLKLQDNVLMTEQELNRLYNAVMDDGYELDPFEEFHILGFALQDMAPAANLFQLLYASERNKREEAYGMWHQLYAKYRRLQRKCRKLKTLTEAHK